jgi:hypothetical protein
VESKRLDYFCFNTSRSGSSTSVATVTGLFQVGSSGGKSRQIVYLYLGFKCLGFIISPDLRGNGSFGAEGSCSLEGAEQGQGISFELVA